MDFETNRRTDAAIIVFAASVRLSVRILHGVWHRGLRCLRPRASDVMSRLIHRTAPYRLVNGASKTATSLSEQGWYYAAWHCI